MLAAKGETPVKYPNSASLFQFCRKVLDHKFGGIRVIDQDVGQILGFDPADCSHWKKGKKNIRSIEAIRSIAQHLGVDEKLVVDVASGDMADWEAFQEYNGYGNFSMDPKVLEQAKKEFYRNHAGSWNQEEERKLKDLFTINEDTIDKIVKKIHKTIKFNEAPLYLPEVVAQYSQLNLRAYEASADETHQTLIRNKQDGEQTVIEYPMDEKMRPFVRFSIAKSIASFFFEEAGLETQEELGEHGAQILEIRRNLFAAKLLTPAHLIKDEMKNIDIQRDIVTQLADTFWVSKTFMNNRLKEILQGTGEL